MMSFRVTYSTTALLKVKTLEFTHLWCRRVGKENTMLSSRTFSFSIITPNFVVRMRERFASHTLSWWCTVVSLLGDIDPFLDSHASQLLHSHSTAVPSVTFSRPFSGADHCFHFQDQRLSKWTKPLGPLITCYPDLLKITTGKKKLYVSTSVIVWLSRNKMSWYLCPIFFWSRCVYECLMNGNMIWNVAKKVVWLLQ